MITAKKPSVLTVAIGALILSAGLGGCAAGNGYGYGYGSYSDSGYPYYNGDVYVSGTWYNGPFRYRDYDGRRQYWVRGTWRDGQHRDWDGRRDRDRDGDRDRDRDRDGFRYR